MKHLLYGVLAMLGFSTFFLVPTGVYALTSSVALTTLGIFCYLVMVCVTVASYLRERFGDLE